MFNNSGMNGNDGNSFKPDENNPVVGSSYSSTSGQPGDFDKPPVSDGGGDNGGGDKPKYVSKKSAVILVIVCIFISFALGILGGSLGSSLVSQNNLNMKVASGTNEGSSGQQQYTGGELTTEGIAEFAADSVVEITTESVQRGTFMQQYVKQGAGSGVIISDNGYIITNNHVISGASKIKVRLKNSTDYEAKVVGTDGDLDVALVKVEATGLKAAVFGDSSALKVGEKVVAIGNPLGELGGTVTQGIISALDREITLDGKSMRLLQVDAAINPGNSGGGLFNKKGELVGLVVAKSSGEAVEGIGFAIPANSVRGVVDDLKSHGYVTGRPALGVTLVNITSTQQAKQNGLSQVGVYIAQVNDGSAAADAGLKVKDNITAIGGEAVSSSEDVSKIIKSHKVGDQLEFTIVRDGQMMNVTATLKESVATSSQEPASSATGGNEVFNFPFGF